MERKFVVELESSGHIIHDALQHRSHNHQISTEICATSGRGKDYQYLYINEMERCDGNKSRK